MHLPASSIAPMPTEHTHIYIYTRKFLLLSLRFFRTRERMQRTMIESFEGKENTSLLTKLDAMKRTSTDVSDTHIGANGGGGATTGDETGQESSDSDQREKSAYTTRARRAAATGLDYTEPSLRSKLRQGSKHTFGLDSIFPTSTLAASSSPEMASEIHADKPYSSFRSNRDRERRRRSSLM